MEPVPGQCCPRYLCGVVEIPSSSPPPPPPSHSFPALAEQRSHKSDEVHHQTLVHKQQPQQQQQNHQGQSQALKPNYVPFEEGHSNSFNHPHQQHHHPSAGRTESNSHPNTAGYAHNNYPLNPMIFPFDPLTRLNMIYGNRIHFPYNQNGQNQNQLQPSAASMQQRFGNSHPNSMRFSPNPSMILKDLVFKPSRRPMIVPAGHGNAINLHSHQRNPPPPQQQQPPSANGHGHNVSPIRPLPQSPMVPILKPSIPSIHVDAPTTTILTTTAASTSTTQSRPQSTTTTTTLRPIITTASTSQFIPLTLIPSSTTKGGQTTDYDASTTIAASTTPSSTPSSSSTDHASRTEHPNQPWNPTLQISCKFNSIKEKGNAVQIQ